MLSSVDQRFALALEAAQLGTWTWDMAARTTEWDARLEELHGIAPGGFGGTFEDWVQAIHPEDRAECLARVERALAEPGPYVLFHRTIWPDGSIHFVECRGAVMTDENGAPTGTTGVAIDVTERERTKRAASKALERQRGVVDVLQQALLPVSPPQVPGITVATRYVAAQRGTPVGGDWYAIVPLPGGRLGVAVGDVAGHGLDAVADMAAARFSLRALSLANPDAPDVVLTRLNEVVQVFSPGTMVTALYGIIDPGPKTWTYANAGHCPALLRRADGTTAWLDDPPDPPLGVATSFRPRSAEVGAAATLVLYTDGLVERRTESIDLGLARLRDACEATASSPVELCEHLVETLLRDEPPRDDVAVLAVAID